MRLRRKLNNRRPVASAGPPSALWRMRCMCGTILEIASDDDGRRQTCSTCRRRFDVRFTEDVVSGQKGVSLLYVTDENRQNGSTSTVGAGTTSFQLPSSTMDADPHGLLTDPDLPEEAHFRCSCGLLLAIVKAQFEKRTRCPSCNARMLVFMLYDPKAGAYTLQLFSLIDPSTGTTQILGKR